MTKFPMTLITNQSINNALLSGDTWGNNTITYSFYAGGKYYGTEDGLATVSDAVKNNVRRIFNDTIAPLIGRNFVEVEDSPVKYGDIRFLLSTTPQYAYTYPPNGSAIGGDIFLNAKQDNNTDPSGFQGGPGTPGYTALMHEMLHALGTKHPNRYSSEDNSPYLAYSEDNGDNTLMTYNFNSGSQPITPMPFDVMALQDLYGSKEYNGSNTTYNFTKIDLYSDGIKTVGDSNLSSKSTIWDSGGTDTLNLANLLPDSMGYRLDMNPGGWLSKQADFNTVEYDVVLDSNLVSFTDGRRIYKATASGTRLAYGVIVENLINSSSSDYIIANSAANIFSGYSPTTTTGKDTIENANSADILDLSSFYAGNISQTQVGNDLLITLGSGSSITIKDYFATPTNQRLNIKMGNPPPVAINDLLPIIKGTTSGTVNPLINDTNPALLDPNDQLKIIGVTDGKYGKVDINGNDLTYTLLSPTYVGDDTFTYTVSNKEGLTATANVNIAVTTTNIITYPVTILNPGDPLMSKQGGSQTNIVNNVSYNFPTNYKPTEAKTALENTLGQTNALFKNIFGLYQVDDATGTVNGIAPGQPGYANAALDKNRVVSNFTVRGGGASNSVSGDLIGIQGKIYTPFVIANGGNYSGSIQDAINEFFKVNPNNSGATAQNYTSLPVAYFSFGAANPDGSAHIKSFGNNVFGFEDLPAGIGISDYDFNDMVFSFG